MVEKVHGKQGTGETEKSKASAAEHQKSEALKLKNMNILTYDVNGNGVIDQPELEKAMDDFQSKFPTVSTAKMAAMAQGYRATDNPNFFYDEKSKKHFMADKNGDLVEAKNVTWVGKDGSYTKQVKNKDGSIRRVNYDKASYPKQLAAFGKDGKVLNSAADAAKSLGLRTTLATESEGVYYDEAAKIHYKWDGEKKAFTAMKDVGMIAANGETFDAKGRNGNSRLQKDGTVVTTEGGYKYESSFDSKGERISHNVLYSDGSKSVAEYNKFGQYVEYFVDANGKSDKNERYTFYPDGHVKTAVYLDGGSTSVVNYHQNGTKSGSKTTDPDGNVTESLKYDDNGALLHRYSAQYIDGHLAESYDEKFDSKGNSLGKTEKYQSASDGMFTTKYDAKGRMVYNHRDYGELSGTRTFSYKDGKNNTSIGTDNSGEVFYTKMVDGEQIHITKEEYDELQK